jgi:glycosyltransferase involved in cell wall biosynthesis
MRGQKKEQKTRVHMDSSTDIRVCAFSYYFPPHFSGAGLQTLSLAKELTKRGVQFLFVTVDNSGLGRRDTVEGFDVYRIADGGKRHGEFVLWWNLWRTLSAIRDRFDVIHASGSTYRNSGVGPISKLLGKKSLTVVSMAHNDLYPVGRTTAGRLQAYFLGFVDRYVALSRQISDEIHNLPLDSDKTVEIPQGIDPHRFSPPSQAQKASLRRQLDLPDAPIALYVGVLDSRKNVKWLVETWSKYRDLFSGWRLLLVGPDSRDAKDANLREKLQAFVQGQGLQGIIMFRDFTPRIEDYYRAADLFVLPSQNEGMPNVVVEAMGCGLPCVVTRISGTTDLITHGESGMLFEVNNEGTFAATIQSLVVDEELRNQIGHQAAAVIRDRFSVEKVADRYLQLYKEMLGEH